MKNTLLLFALVFCSTSGVAQKKSYAGFPSLIWPKLYDISYTKAKDKDGEFEKPVFSVAAKSLNGKIISLPGYIVPFENAVKSKHIMFSSLPLNACFFCGVGGPETVVEVFLKEEISYSEKPFEIQGVLKLNDADPDKMIYVLEKAEITGEVDF
jgi:hypothetical protein